MAKELIDRVASFLPVEFDITEDYLSVSSIKTAVWQYLIDHSKIVGKDTIKITFYIPSEKEFWKRVKAREDGRFKRNDLYDFHKKMREREAFVESLMIGREMSDRKNKRLGKLLLHKSWYTRTRAKAVILLRRLANKILDDTK